jgi:hypothetical protein
MHGDLDGKVHEKNLQSHKLSPTHSIQHNRIDTLVHLFLDQHPS